MGALTPRGSILNICRLLVEHDRRHNWLHRDKQAELVRLRYAN